MAPTTRGKAKSATRSPKVRVDRQKKRSFHGNRYTRATAAAAAAEAALSSSGQKLGVATAPRDAPVEGDISGYRLLDVGELVLFVQQFPCRSCHHQGCTVSDKLTGLSTVITFTCTSCDAAIKLEGSPRENVNLRFQTAIYSIGGHYTHGQRFLGNMDMPPPVSVTRATHFRRVIGAATEKVARASMVAAGRELRAALPDDKATVSCDGTWQRRGFASKNGVATVLSVNPAGPAKVVDVHVASNHCDACSKAKSRMDNAQFAAWFASHKPACSKNHEGSAGQMEPAGMLTIFRRSEELHQLRYRGYLGDGDSKSFATVSKAAPPVYGTDCQVEKLECCGHVQKRMGKRLIDKVAELKSSVHSEGGKKFKGIGGAAGLTRKAIKSIQGHYGGAIRGNVGDVGNMKTAVMAIWKHRNRDHVDCGAWCPANNGDLDKANRHALPSFVIKAIKPVFDALSSDSLMLKCVHGGTQNPNESFHHLIWNRCPKTVFVGRERLEVAVHDAVIVFNEGEVGRLSVFEKLGLLVGVHARAAFRTLDRKRVESAERQASMVQKARRKHRSLAATGEGPTGEAYQAGAF